MVFFSVAAAHSEWESQGLFLYWLSQTIAGGKGAIFYDIRDE